MVDKKKKIGSKHEKNNIDALKYPYAFPSDRLHEYELVGGLSLAEAKEVISKVEGPIVEIGGPTDDGYFYLDGVSLKSKPIITNKVSFQTFPIDQDIAAQLDQQIDVFFDGRDMPYMDDSLGIVMMSYITRADDAKLFPEGREPTQEEIDLTNQCFDKADQEVQDFLEDNITSEDIKESYILKIYEEVMRVLRPGGLFITNSNKSELRALEKIGFKVISLSTDDEGHDSFEYVAQKPQNYKYQN